MAGKEAFHEKIRRLGDLVGELDAMPGGGNPATRELVQLLLDVHGSALQRILDIVFESGPQGEAIIARAGDDPIVRHLLLLHSLHPDDLETRFHKALDAAKAKLRKYNSEVELLSMNEGAVQLKIHASTSGHACGSTAKTVQLLVEESIYDQAPDLASLEILGPDDEVSSGFVSIDSLLKQSSSAMAARGVVVCGAD